MFKQIEPMNLDLFQEDFTGKLRSIIIFNLNIGMELIHMYVAGTL